MPPKGDKPKRLGKGLGALIRHYDLDEQKVKEAHQKAEEEKKQEAPEKHEKKKQSGSDQDMGRLTVYKKALVQAHADGVISDDEKAMLSALRQYLMIDEDEHDILEQQVIRKRK